jgi:hypothetical protein
MTAKEKTEAERDALQIEASIMAGECTVDVQGHSQVLRVVGLRSSCGSIRNGDGISFAFDRDGCWVISREELRRLVAAADALDAAEQARLAMSAPGEE